MQLHENYKIWANVITVFAVQQTVATSRTWVVPLQAPLQFCQSTYCFGGEIESTKYVMGLWCSFFLLSISYWITQQWVGFQGAEALFYNIMQFCVVLSSFRSFRVGYNTGEVGCSMTFLYCRVVHCVSNPTSSKLSGLGLPNSQIRSHRAICTTFQPFACVTAIFPRSPVSRSPIRSIMAISITYQLFEGRYHIYKVTRGCCL